MRKGFLGAVRIAHMNYMENAGELINRAKYDFDSTEIDLISKFFSSSENN